MQKQKLEEYIAQIEISYNFQVHLQGLIEVLTKRYGLQLPKLPYAIKDTKSCHFFT